MSPSAELDTAATCERRERRGDARLAVALVVAFLVASNALQFAGLRAPFHDTAWELLVWRMWVSDLLHAGDWPLWFPTARYGFPLTTLQFGPGPWSPVGLLIGALTRAGVHTFVFESVCWQLVGIAGTYLFARRHLVRPLTATAAALAYAGSGVLMEVAGGGSIGGSMLASVMLAPWLLVAVHTLIDADGWRRRCQAIGFTALVGALLVINGYPGISLTLPALIAPYVLCLGCASRRLRQVLAGSLAAGVLVVGMLALFVVDTLRYPVFGPGFRDPVDAGNGTLAVVSAFGLWLPDPSYLADSDVTLSLTYLGLVLALLLSASAPRRLMRSPVTRAAIVTAAGMLAVVGTAAPSGGAGAPQLLPLSAILAAAAAFPGPFRRWEARDIALGLAAALAIAAATENPLGDFLRHHVPPFTLVRWNHFYIWLASLMLVTLAWRTAEQAAALANPHRLVAVWRRRVTTAVLSAAVLLAAVTVLAAAYCLFFRGTNPSFHPGAIGAADLAWLVCLAAIWALGIATYAIVRARRRDGRRPSPRPASFLLCGAHLALAVALATGHARIRDVFLAHPYVALPQGGLFFFDVLQGVLLLAALAASALHSRTAQGLLRLAVVVSVADLTLAGARYLKSGDYPINAVVSLEDLGPPRDVSFAFSGVARTDLPNGGSSEQRMRQLIAKRPSLAPMPFVQPALAAFDHAIGEPTAFARLTYFPSDWRLDATGRDVAVGVDAFRALAHPEPDGAPPIPGTGCAAGQSVSVAPPEASVTRLLSSVVRVSATTACARLLVYMDAWSPGWQAFIDGQPTQSLRVDGAVRGVIVPAGHHEVEWRYRPEHLGLLLGTMAAATLAAAAMVCMPLFRPAGRLARVHSPVRGARQEHHGRSGFWPSIGHHRRGRQDRHLLPAAPQR